MEEPFVGEVSVDSQGDLPQKEVTDPIGADLVHENLRIKGVPFGLRHLLLVHKPPPVGDDLLGRLQIHRHEEGGPEDSVKTEDVLPDQLNLSGPPLLPGIPLFGVPDGGKVVEEGVEPNVDGLRGVAGDGNPPFHCGSGDAQVPEAAGDERDHLVHPPFRNDEAGVLPVEPEEPFGVGGESEEVDLLGERLRDPAAVGAETVPLGIHRRIFTDVEFAADTVVPGVGSLVDIPLIEKLLENSLYPADMKLVRGPDEVVVLDSHLRPQPLEALYDFVD